MIVERNREVEQYLDQVQQGLRYAELIQQALLPKKRHFERIFKDAFVFYKPQNHVSGDFYWIGQKDGLKYIAVGDCTGHGVSAALLSVLASNILEYLVINKGIKKTNKILIELDKKFIESFSNVDEVVFNNDWVDISLCCIDEKKKRIYFSSANRKMMHVNINGKTKLLKGSSYPIGGWQIEENRDFKSTSLAYENGDTIYLGSDGYQDQFGGPENKKYKSGHLHDFLAQCSSFSMSDQYFKIHDEFYSWKNNNEQQDDVCIVGIRL